MLIRRTDMEDALKRLEYLIQEEALMAIAQNTRDMRNLHVRVTEVIDGMQNVFSQSPKQYPNLESFRWEESKEGYETNSQKRRPSEMFVILNLISDYRALLILFREPISRDHSQVALPTGSNDES